MVERHSRNQDTEPTGLADRVALVTGGSRGIGEAIARALGDAGASVAINYRSRRSDAERVAEGLVAAGARARIFQADVTRPQAVAEMVAAVETELGPPGILVNNAGSAVTRTIDDISLEDFDEALSSHLRSAFMCMQAVLPRMRERRWGRIVNISSIGASTGAGSVSVGYGAAKAGLEGLTRAYALRLAAEGITVNAVAPGLVDTDMGRPLIDAGVASKIPMGRSGRPAEIAQAVLHLIQNAYVTGQTMAVNGGSRFQ